MPERTTYDYDGPGMNPRVQAAINGEHPSRGNSGLPPSTRGVVQPQRTPGEGRVVTPDRPWLGL
jgi:hypothetical protein